jgi:hypothetical protein
MCHAKGDREDNVAPSDTCQVARGLQALITGLTYRIDITTISEKDHSGVLHYLRSNRGSKLCRNAFDRLRISDTRLFPAFQILPLEVSLDPSKQERRDKSHFKIY